jgi:hypothetical protein
MEREHPISNRQNEVETGEANECPISKEKTAMRE